MGSTDVTDVLARTVVMESVESLHEHEANPRQGDVGMVVDLIESNGYLVPVVAQTSTRRVIDGNHRLQAARHLGMTEIPVSWVDVDDATALRHLLGSNRASDSAAYDDQSLAALLTDLATTSGLDGTGWDNDSLDSLLADLNTPVDPEPSATTYEVSDEHECPECGHRWSDRPKGRLLSRAFAASGT